MLIGVRWYENSGGGEENARDNFGHGTHTSPVAGQVEEK